MLELLALLLATPGAILALHELRTLRAIARAAARPRIEELEVRVRVRIRR